MHPRVFNEGKPNPGEAQWRLSRTFWRRQDIGPGKLFLLLAKDATRRATVCGQMQDVSTSEGA